MKGDNPLMKVTVKESLQMDLLKNVNIIAGKNGLDNKIKSVSILEGVNAQEAYSYAARQGELVLSGFFHVRDDVAEQCKIVKALSERECAGLMLFYVGKIVKKIPSEVMDTADKCGLPLMIMSGSELSCADVMKKITEELLYGDNFGNRLISNTIFHLLNFEKHSSFQAAAKEAAINNGFQLILLSGDFNPILSVETRHKVSIEEAIRIGRSRDVSASPVYTLVDVNGVLTYWGPVNINGEKHFMFLVDNDDCYSAAEMTKLAEIIEIAMGMWKYTPERDAKAELIKALKRGNKSLAYTLKSEAGIEGNEILCAFYARFIETHNGNNIITDFENESGLHIMKVIEGDDTYGLVLASDIGTDDDMAQNRAKCIDLFNRLKEEKSVRIFHVTGVTGIEGAGDAYRLISEAWSFVQNVFPYKRVFTKYELVLVSNCINIQLQGGYIRKNYAFS